MNAKSVEPIVEASSTEVVLQCLERNVNDNGLSQKPFIGNLTSKTEPLLSRVCNYSSSGNSTVIGDSETLNSPMELDSEGTGSTTLDNMMQSDHNAVFKQSAILNKASTYSSNATALGDMIFTYKTASETVGRSEQILSGPSNSEKSLKVDQGPKLEFAASIQLESKAESSPTKFSPDAESMRVLCSDLLKFKFSHLNNPHLLNEPKLIIAKLESTMRLAEPIKNQIYEILSKDMPETESKVQNAKLKYIIASSSRAYARISQQMIEFQEHMQGYIEQTVKVNDGMDERLSRVVTAICSSNKCNENF